MRQRGRWARPSHCHTRQSVGYAHQSVACAHHSTARAHSHPLQGSWRTGGSCRNSRRPERGRRHECACGATDTAGRGTAQVAAPDTAAAAVAAATRSSKLPARPRAGRVRGLFGYASLSIGRERRAVLGVQRRHVHALRAARGCVRERQRWQRGRQRGPAAGAEHGAARVWRLPLAAYVRARGIDGTVQRLLNAQSGGNGKRRRSPQLRLVRHDAHVRSRRGVCALCSVRSNHGNNGRCQHCAAAHSCSE